MRRAKGGRYESNIKPKTRRYGKTGRLAAVEGGVADVAAGDEIDDVFGDVGGVVADAFEIFGNHDEFEGGEDNRGIFHHVGEQFTEELIAKAIDLVVTLEDGLREFLVAADKGVEAIADHGFGEFA